MGQGPQSAWANLPHAASPPTESIDFDCLPPTLSTGLTVMYRKRIHTVATEKI